MQGLTPAQFIEFHGYNDTPPRLLDVRESWEHDICRVEGARLLPMSRITDELHDLDKERPIMVLCHHGMRSPQVAHYLLRNGFTEVFNPEGGIAAWASEMEPDMPDY